MPQTLNDLHTKRSFNVMRNRNDMQTLYCCIFSLLLLCDIYLLYYMTKYLSASLFGTVCL